MKNRRRWPLILLFIFLTYTILFLPSAESALQGVDLTNSNGDVIGMLFEDTPVVVTAQTGSTARVIISGFVESGFADQNQALSTIEGLDGVLFGELSFQDVFGTSVRLIGIVQNDSAECYGALNLEASLWDENGQLVFVEPFNVWQVNRGSITPFRTDRFFTTLEEAAQLSVRIRFISSSGCSQGGGGGGGGVEG